MQRNSSICAASGRNRWICRNPYDADQDKEAGHRGQVVKLKRREEVGSQCESRQRDRDPCEAPLPHGRNERQDGQVERRKEEEPVIADAIFQPLEIAAQRLRSTRAKCQLRFVAEFLLRRQFHVRGRVGLERQGRRHAVLILAELIRERGPTAGDALVLEQRDSQSQYYARPPRSARRAAAESSLAPACRKTGTKNNATQRNRKIDSNGRMSRCSASPAPSAMA